MKTGNVFLLTQNPVMFLESFSSIFSTIINAFKGPIVNRTCHFMNGWATWNYDTVPLILKIKDYSLAPVSEAPIRTSFPVSSYTKILVKIKYLVV